jgi:hypothetical protein
MLLTYAAFALGALCMLLGFFTVAKGIGAGDSQTTIKMFGIEFRAERLGPGLVFSLLGLILVLVAVFVQPKLNGQAPAAVAGAVVAPAAANVAGAAPAASPSQASAPASQAPSAPLAAPAATAPAAAPAGPRPMTHEEVAALIQDTLTRMAQGECPAANLEPIPLVECSQSMASGIQQRLVIAGPIRSVTYFGPTMTPVGQVDQYLVVHQNAPLLWKAAVSENRKLTRLWNGPP